MYHGGLILEGGGMRGVYTAGVLDAFLENDIKFEKIYGVSAGSCHACSYMSGQYGRAFRVAVDYLDDPDYCGTRTFLRTGNIFKLTKNILVRSMRLLLMWIPENRFM